MKTHYLVPLFFLLFLLSSCIGVKHGMDSEQLSSQPTPISGSCATGEECAPRPPGSGTTNSDDGPISAFNFSNGTMQCQFMVEPNRFNYQTQCRAYVLQADGSSVVASGLDSGVSVRWKEPSCVNNVPVDEIDCRVEENGLVYECEITLKGNSDDDDEDDEEGKKGGKGSSAGSMASMEFQLEIQDAAMGMRMESQMLTPAF